MEEQKKITLKELVEIREDEMRHVLPGFQTEVTDGKHIVIVKSPDSFNRSTFKVGVK